MRILIADDSRSVVNAIKSTLESQGYEVVVAADGREAVEKFKQYRPALVSLDVQMPEMDGFEACAAIRALEGDEKTPIIFVTSKDTLADRERGFLLGASEFISKRSVAPWKEVGRAVDRILLSQTRIEGATILVLEGEEISRMLIRTWLRAYGVQVLEAASSNEGLEIAASRVGEIDLVIADCILPGINAHDLLTTLRLKIGMRHIPIIFLAAADQRDIILELFHAGATDYIVKPFAKEEFIARITSHLEIRQLVKELSSNVAELERLNKRHDEFVAVSSHDLRSPLTSIMGFTDLLLMEEQLPANYREWLNIISNSSKFMVEIVNDIVELSRNEAKGAEIELSPISVDALVRLAIVGLEQTARKKGLELELQNQAEAEVIIAGERNKFTRLLNNLLSNAVKFTPRGGTVAVAIGKDDQHVTLTVTDTGTGISETMLPTLFDRFTKASKPGTEGEPGTGLGMSITKQLVDLHHGTIQVESVPGKGTSFHLTFPLLSASHC